MEVKEGDKMEPEIKARAQGNKPKKLPKVEIIIVLLLAGVAFYFFGFYSPGIQQNVSEKQILESGNRMIRGLKQIGVEKAEKRAREEAEKRALLQQQEPDEEELLRLEVEKQNEASKRIREEQERLLLQQQRLEEEIIKMQQEEDERLRQEEKLMEERLRKERELMQ
ncbi:MAG: hypothetical protein ABIG56_05605 [Candidatus Omnitrophota bacterium]